MDRASPRIAFHHDYRSLSFPRRRLVETARRIAEGERLEGIGAISVVLCSDYKIRKLNQQYRGKDRATDVLSFRFDDSDFLGEIYISLQRAAVQARKYGFSYAEEIERLFVHGIFHLLGYTHDTDRTRRDMESREARYCCLDARR